MNNKLVMDEDLLRGRVMAKKANKKAPLDFSLPYVPGGKIPVSSFLNHRKNKSKYHKSRLLSVPLSPKRTHYNVKHYEILIGIRRVSNLKRCNKF